jgi:hypothetical protein
MRGVNSSVEGSTTPLPRPAPAPPVASAPPAPPAPVSPVGSVPPETGTAVTTSLATTSGEQCPSCGTHMVADQRYCLECGHRRGDPRLPFMDAVVFMNAVKRPRDAAPPPPPRERRPRMSANASLIAGVATLVLAIGVGVLIGRSGEQGSTPVANSAPQIIKVGGGGEEAAATASGGKSAASKSGKSKQAKAPEKAIDSSGTSEAAAEVLKPAGDVKLPPPTVQPGGKCESGAAGCKGGEFTGEFFGE